jgi:CspA family cold shock protein
MASRSRARFGDAQSENEDGKMVDRLSGTLKMWNEARGFGFIIRDDDERDIFVHASQVVENDPLRPGERVSFIEDHGPDQRLRARQVLRAAP